MTETEFYTKEDIIVGMEMPGRKCWSHPDRKDAVASTGRPKGEVGSKYPYASMKPGDCFVAGNYTERLQQRMIGNAGKWAAAWSPESKFITRQIKNKLFVWKIK